MKSILVPTDFSKCAYVAAHFAVELAHITKARIVLLNTFQIPMPPPDSFVTPISYTEIREDSLKRLKTMADTELRINQKYSDLKIEYDAVLGGTVNEIIDAAKKYDAEMIVIGTHGASGVVGKIIGTTAASVIEKAPIPVFAIPEKAKFNGFKKITLAIDFNEIKNMSSITSFLKLSALFNSNIDILSVINKAEQKALIEKEMESIKQLKIFEPSPHSFHIVLNENVPQAIESFAEQTKSELLVTMPQKHNFWELILNKSVTQGLAFQIKIPLLCLPPPSK